MTDNTDPVTAPTFVKRVSVKGVMALALLLAVVGCAAPKETATITERVPVERVGSTESSSSAREAARVPRQQLVPVTNPSGVSGRFDGGKMWTFDDPPTAYFEEAYGFTPGQRWFDKARLGALRFSTYCSASFVSGSGLVMTNHHCGRQSISSVSKAGENLLDNGFYAETLSSERKVDDLFVEQLISIEDVTQAIYAGVNEKDTPENQVSAREKARAALEKKMTDSVQKRDSIFTVQVIELYNGGKYSAYTFKKYTDVRLVMAPELQLGFFGGDWDNFTFPRYVLDMSFFRVYAADNTPLESKDFFKWSANGASVGEPTFVIGNPGSTSRLSTVSQLEFERDVSLPQAIRVIESRSKILKQFVEQYPVLADSLDLRNTYFSLENSHKANEGQLAGLEDPEFMGRKAAGEEKLKSYLASDSLTALYGTLFTDLDEMQIPKRAVAKQSGAFTYFSSGVMTSHILLRGLYAYVAELLKQRGAPDERVEEMKTSGLEVSNWPKEIEKAYIAARLTEMQDYLGSDHPSVRSILAGQSPDSVASALVESTAIIDSTGYAKLLKKGYLTSGDISVTVVQSLAELYFSLGQQRSQFEDREKNLNARLGRAQFAVYGTAVPPDASFSLRIADGIVADYEYNGTKAPVHTTFYGLYDRYHSFTGTPEWDLPSRWVPVPERLDLGVPLNIVSTNDITGGNSGSPMLNSNLEVVGLVFDSNIEALPNEYLYLDESGRTISVDSRGILEALGSVYDASRLVDELKAGEVTDPQN